MHRTPHVRSFDDLAPSKYVWRSILTAAHVFLLAFAFSLRNGSLITVEKLGLDAGAPLRKQQ
jgi:hypothetical protein